MKLSLFYILLACACICTISSCKDDDEVPIAGIEFELEEQEVSESDGTINSFNPEIEGVEDSEGRIVHVNLKFDRPLADNVVVEFRVSGSARKTSTAQELRDFMIAEEGTNLTVDDDEITLLKGSESASFHVILYEDLRYEYDENGEFNDDNIPYETIEIELESIVSGPGQLGKELEHTLKILEDDLFVILAWDAQDFDDEDQASAEVDMDFFAWYSELIWQGGVNRDKDFEVTFLPAGLGEGEVEFSYTYHSGKSDDLLFQVAYFSAAGTLNGNRYIDEPLIFEGNYTLANLHPWTPQSPPKSAQTATKEGIDYVNFSDLEEFPEGSRTKRLIPTKLSKEMMVEAVKNFPVQQKINRK